MVRTLRAAYFRRMQTSTSRVLPCVFIASLAMATACGETSLKANAPAIVTNGALLGKLPELPPSVVDAPIAYEIEPVLAALEDAVPRKFGDLDKRIKNANNRRQEFAFAATRTPFKMSLDGDELTLTTTVEYQGRGWYDPVIGGAISGGCDKQELRPRLLVSVISNLELTNDWRFTPRTRIRNIAPPTETERDQCRVTFLSIDVTGKVVDALRGQLVTRLPRVDAQLARFDLRSRIEKWYNLLNRSVKVGDSLWMVFNPGVVRYGGLRLNDSTLVADIRLFAQPVMISGPKPPEKFSPLPPLQPAAKSVGDTARVMIEASIGYDVASEMLKKQLVGRTFKKYGRNVRIAYVRCYGLGDGRLAVGVQFSGSLQGEGYLVGTPKFDAASNMLYVPDLNFDVATSDKLVQGVAWLKKEDVVEQLREIARFPLEDVLADTRNKVEGKINRELTRGVHLNAKFTTGRVIDVVALERAMIVRAEAVGTLGLILDRELPPLKKAAKPKGS
ncbi:MAG: DUF4403 family protein [Phycisphaerae bacterium]|nr:DUF4403 family protein [Gemmatimonadaceae bacterium]